MQVLVAMAQAPGATISRDELVERCWDGRIVGDNAVHRAISRLRLLGEDFGGAFTIETVPRIGYRLEAATDADPTPPASADPASRFDAADDSAPSKKKGPDRRMLVGAIAGTALALGGTGIWWRGRRSRAMTDLLAQGDEAMRVGLPADSLRAVDLYRQAADADTASALAWGRHALACAICADFVPPARTAGLVADANLSARRALTIDRDQADARGSMAILPPYFGDWQAAEQRMNQVLDRHPRHLRTRDARAFLLGAVGRIRESALDRLTLIDHNPVDAGYMFRMIYGYWFLDRTGDADRLADRLLQSWPAHPGAWFARMWVLIFTGRADRALAHLEDAAFRPALPEAMVTGLRLALQAMVTRRPGDIAAAVDDIRQSFIESPTAAINALMILNGLDAIDEAFAVADAYLLETGPLIARLNWRPGDPQINDHGRRKTNMLFTPACAPMRADPRFLELTDRIGLSGYWQRLAVTPDFLAVQS